MTHIPKSEVLTALEDSFIIPLFYNGDIDTAIEITKACYNGGAKVVEYTNRGEAALEVFEKMGTYSRENLPGMILGAGSIANTSSAADFIKAGADFIVGPFFKKEIAIYCQDQDIAYLPGCATPTEISNAEQQGVEICKIFPAAQLGGPGFIKAIMAPMPNSKLMATGGVENTLENLTEWYQSGVTCVGMGSTLLSSDLIKAGDFKSIQENVSKAVEFARLCRQ